MKQRLTQTFNIMPKGGNQHRNHATKITALDGLILRHVKVVEAWNVADPTGGGRLCKM
jgi:hypothetical protein